MLKMWRKPFWQGFFISIALPSAAVLSVLYFHEYGLEDNHSIWMVVEVCKWIW